MQRDTDQGGDDAVCLRHRDAVHQAADAGPGCADAQGVIQLWVIPEFGFD